MSLNKINNFPECFNKKNKKFWLKLKLNKEYNKIKKENYYNKELNKNKMSQK